MLQMKLRLRAAADITDGADVELRLQAGRHGIFRWAHRNFAARSRIAPKCKRGVLPATNEPLLDLHELSRMPCPAFN